MTRGGLAVDEGGWGGIAERRNGQSGIVWRMGRDNYDDAETFSFAKRIVALVEYMTGGTGMLKPVKVHAEGVDAAVYAFGSL